MAPLLVVLRALEASSSGVSGMAGAGAGGIGFRLGSKPRQPAMLGAQNSPKRAAGMSQRAPPGSSTRAPVTELMTWVLAQPSAMFGACGRSPQLLVWSSVSMLLLMSQGVFRP